MDKNMKIGFIGGPKDFNSIDTENYPKDKEGLIFTHVLERSGFQRSCDGPESYDYKKLLLQFNGEFKYFYVLNNSTANSLKEIIREYWDLSELIGLNLDI